VPNATYNLAFRAFSPLSEKAKHEDRILHLYSYDRMTEYIKCQFACLTEELPVDHQGGIGMILHMFSCPMAIQQYE
jgi:hypothetical protein